MWLDGRCCAAAGGWARAYADGLLGLADDLTALVSPGRTQRTQARPPARAASPRPRPRPAQLRAASDAEHAPRGARRHIAAHYDLGNELFARDARPERMMLLVRACSRRRARRSRTRSWPSSSDLREARPRARGPPARDRDRLGRAWPFMPRPTRGCRVTTTTISREQHELRASGGPPAGLEDRIDGAAARTTAT